MHGQITREIENGLWCCAKVVEVFEKNRSCSGLLKVTIVRTRCASSLFPAAEPASCQELSRLPSRSVKGDEASRKMKVATSDAALKQRIQLNRNDSMSSSSSLEKYQDTNGTATCPTRSAKISHLSANLAPHTWHRRVISPTPREQTTLFLQAGSKQIIVAAHGTDIAKDITQTLAQDGGIFPKTRISLHFPLQYSGSSVRTAAKNSIPPRAQM